MFVTLTGKSPGLKGRLLLDRNRPDGEWLIPTLICSSTECHNLGASAARDPLALGSLVTVFLVSALDQLSMLE